MIDLFPFNNTMNLLHIFRESCYGPSIVLDLTIIHNVIINSNNSYTSSTVWDIRPTDGTFLLLVFLVL